ncbi:hypothetical protein G2W53_021821 [Senna tora]|uniref:DUF4283 domain-containing protein n=1 Tax=Senna tora TaxID=362788 RepID=A0A834TK51_9FABA|nr:hypothetical protein G2W53_021821 [Senna tora]
MGMETSISPMEVSIGLNEVGKSEGMAQLEPMVIDSTTKEQLGDVNMNDVTELKGSNGAEINEGEKHPKELSYKERLLRINGRCKNHVSEDEQDSESETSDEDLEEVMETKEEIFCPTLTISHEEKVKLYKDWKYSLYVKVLGKSLALNFLAMRLQRMWQKNGTIRVVDIEVGDENFGPWMIPQRNIRRIPRQNPNLGAKPNQKVQGENIASSRFAVLSNLEDNEPMAIVPVKQVEPLVTEEAPQASTTVVHHHVKEQAIPSRMQTPSEKANDHTVVILHPGGFKRTSISSHQKSPVKMPDTSHKPIKASVDTSKPKPRKMPDFDETLEHMRIYEKSMGKTDRVLDELGAIQVGVAAKSFPALVKIDVSLPISFSSLSSVSSVEGRNEGEGNHWVTFSSFHPNTKPKFLASLPPPQINHHYADVISRVSRQSKLRQQR